MAKMGTVVAVASFPTACSGRKMGCSQRISKKKGSVETEGLNYLYEQRDTVHH